MTIDISELVQASKKRFGLIFPNSIKIENNELIFVYAYLNHLPNPFDSYYDTENQELHVLIQQNAFHFGSACLVQRIQLSKDTKKVKVDYRGNLLDNLTIDEGLNITSQN
jgi:hypothetical protein